MIKNKILNFINSYKKISSFIESIIECIDNIIGKYKGDEVIDKDGKHIANLNNSDNGKITNTINEVGNTIRDVTKSVDDLYRKMKIIGVKSDVENTIKTVSNSIDDLIKKLK